MGLAESYVPVAPAPAGRLRVGIDGTSWLNRRGYGRFVRELLGHLVQIDSSIEYSMIVDFDPSLAPPVPDAVEVRRVHTRHPAAHAAAASGRRSLRDMWAVSQALTRGGFDVIFFPTAYTYVPVFGRTPIAIVIHDTIAEQFPTYVFPTRQAARFWRAKLWMAQWQASVVMTISNASRRAIADHWGIPIDRIRIICEAADPIFRAGPPDRSTGGALQKLDLLDRRFVLYVGGISPHKNLGVLIDAVAALRKRPAFADVLLVLVGDYTTDVFHSAYEELRQQRHTLDLDASVIFAGYVPDADLVHLYNAASAFVLPSVMEGFGLPAIEAMACGTPVIVSDRGALPEIVDNAGIVFDLNDRAALERSLEQVLDHADTRATLRARGHQRAAQYSWHRAARDTVAALRALAAPQQR